MLLRFAKHALVAFWISVLPCAGTFAEGYPSKPIHILVGFAPGGATDIVARVYAEKLQTLLGVPVLVENKPGAAQLIVMREVQTAPPDGYTLSVATVSALTQAPAFRPVATYDPLKDFTPVAMIATAPGIFAVSPTAPIHSLQELIAAAKAKPRDILFSTAGVGSANDVQMAFVEHATGISMSSVPYRSDQEATLAVISGQVNICLTVANFALPFVVDGKLRPIAVSAAHRMPQLPDIQTLTELGIPGLSDVTYLSYYGMVGPRGLDPAIAQRLNDAINKAAQMPDVVKTMRDQLYMDIKSGTPNDFRDFLTKDLANWLTLQRETGIKF